MSFAFNSRYVLLTYAQSDGLSEWDVLEHISGLGAECIIARENHADGGTHLHAFCDFGRKFRSRRSDIFDVGGRHANITPSRGRPEFGWDYAVKDGDVVAGGLARPGSGGLPEAPNKWGQIVGAENEQQFWELVEELDPKALATQYPSLRKFADWRFRPVAESYVHPDGLEFELGMVPELVEWREQSLGHDLVIYGPTKVGKTTWARSLGNHVYFMGVMSGEVALRDMHDADYAVFDDMRGGIEFFPSWKEWLGSQAVVTVKKLYRDPVQVKWGKPSIWLSNADPRSQLRSSVHHANEGKMSAIENDIAWLEGNCQFVYIEDSIISHANTD
ncbi:replication-associated protein [Giant panda associated gemycircularvirus]|uniref:Replication-associated protein n=1 Tax=Giant panda associated gemycircularvirus TaxID=2016461 RepID=A0A220IGP9_9VIRU|nr:replication-associated protein [Giant panda associated gemycircularvirus]ASH99148.1 replication-associated protein [Giant panda associated gemycircularvirus]